MDRVDLFFSVVCGLLLSSLFSETEEAEASERSEMEEVMGQWVVETVQLSVWRRTDAFVLIGRATWSKLPYARAPFPLPSATEDEERSGTRWVPLCWLPDAQQFGNRLFEGETMRRMGWYPYAILPASGRPYGPFESSWAWYDPPHARDTAVYDSDMTLSDQSQVHAVCLHGRPHALQLTMRFDGEPQQHADLVDFVRRALPQYAGRPVARWSCWAIATEAEWSTRSTAFDAHLQRCIALLWHRFPSAHSVGVVPIVPLRPLAVYLMEAFPQPALRRLHWSHPIATGPSVPRLQLRVGYLHPHLYTADLPAFYETRQTIDGAPFARLHLLTSNWWWHMCATRMYACYGPRRDRNADAGHQQSGPGSDASFVPCVRYRTEPDSVYPWSVVTSAVHAHLIPPAAACPLCMEPCRRLNEDAEDLLRLRAL